MAKPKPSRKVIVGPRSDDREDDPVFRIKFWRRVGAEGRFAAAWEMTKLIWRLQGGVGEPRFDKSAERMIRRERPVRTRRKAR